MTTTAGFQTGLTLLEDPRHPGDDQAALSLFNRIAEQITAENQMSRQEAGRALDQAIIFVTAAARNTATAMSPSPQVEKAWDVFFLNSIEYHHHCERYGRFVHHTPNDNPEILNSVRRFHTPAETADILRRAGYFIHDDLWPTDAVAGAKANCTSCYDGGHDGGGDGT